MRVGAIESFINWIEIKTLADHWSFDAAVGYAKHKGLFMRNEMVCTKTLYNYLHKGVLGIKAIDLPLVVRRSQRKSISRKHKRELGKSIELRDPNIETREEFGHWELDTVRGTKDKTDHVLISLLERKSRLYVALRGPSARAADVKETLYTWLNMFKNVNLACLCKTITADNGLELTLMVQNYSHGKLMDTKELEGVAFSVDDFKVLLEAVPQAAYTSILRSLPFFFTLIGLKSQFQGYQHRFAFLNDWID